jgi:hypothetical protein
MRPVPLLALILLAGAPACADDPVTPPPADEPTSVEVDASQTWAFINLTTGAPVTVADPAASDQWDVAFFATGVMLNGGAAGPGGVEGYCVCQNADASDDAILAMTADGERADFDAVTTAALPADESSWLEDALDPAIAGWYAGTPGAATAQPGAVFLIKLRGAPFAKLHVIEVQGSTTQHAGTVTVEFAVQAGAGQPLGPPDTLTLDASLGRVFVDLVAGAVGTSTSWDVALDGYAFLTNGGVSGTGGVGAVATTTAFDAITDAGAAPLQVYRGDRFGGVFAAAPWYRYNLDGNNTISPTFDVYLVRRGTSVWRLQVVSYYDIAGAPRHITIRYAPLEG